MNDFLAKFGLTEKLEWFEMQVWLYHMIKLLTGATVSFALFMVGVPLLIACLIGMVGPVVIPHTIYFVTKKYPFNVDSIKDTIFDTITSSIAFPTVLIHMYGWSVGLAGFAVWFAAYFGLAKLKWNSP